MSLLTTSPPTSNQLRGEMERGVEISILPAVSDGIRPHAVFLELGTPTAHFICDYTPQMLNTEYRLVLDCSVMVPRRAASDGVLMDCLVNKLFFQVKLSHRRPCPPILISLGNISLAGPPVSKQYLPSVYVGSPSYARVRNICWETNVYVIYSLNNMRDNIYNEQTPIIGNLSLQTDTGNQSTSAMHCSICNVTCNSSSSYTQHLTGRRHRRNQVLQPWTFGCTCVFFEERA